ncbi:MAG: hypothetical protein ABIF18_04245 [archaeon]
MIIGLLLGISIAISLASFGIIITGTTGALRENLATGAVIGTTGAVSYAIIVFVLSLVVTFFLISILKKPSLELADVGSG